MTPCTDQGLADACEPSGLAKTISVVIAAEQDPLVCSRVLAFFAQRNLIPSWFSAWKESEEVLQIVLRVTFPAGVDCRYLSHRLESIPCAITVEATVDES